MSAERPIILATRGSALALAQANMVLAQCRQSFPDLQFEIQIIKTTGDKKLTASMAQPDPSLPKGLFTKELEVALLNGEADLAVHSLKDLPTELPSGLMLGAVGVRADVRDVLIYRDAGGGARGYGAGLQVRDLPTGAVVATSSTRRRAQLLELNPGLEIVEIRGNVATRLRKVAEQAELDATLLAAAGLHRLHYRFTDDGFLLGEDVPAGLRANMIPAEDMLPCVGQAAIGIEVRTGDEQIAKVCSALNDEVTFSSVVAERSFLRAMGGGCQSPVGAHAVVDGGRLRVQAVSFTRGAPQRAIAEGDPADAIDLGRSLAEQLK